VRQLKQHGPLPGFRKANKKYLHKVRDRLNGLETALRDTSPRNLDGFERVLIG
jgi:hypothetical protein